MCFHHSREGCESDTELVPGERQETPLTAPELRLQRVCVEMELKFPRWHKYLSNLITKVLLLVSHTQNYSSVMLQVIYLCNTESKTTPVLAVMIYCFLRLVRLKWFFHPWNSKMPKYYTLHLLGGKICGFDGIEIIKMRSWMASLQTFSENNIKN